MSGFLNILAGAAGAMSRLDVIAHEIAKWKQSTARKRMIDGKRYYLGEHDIIDRNRTVIGRDGLLEVVKNLPNNKIIDNQYTKMVDQKVNYLLGQPVAFDSENEEYADNLNDVFDRNFHRTFKAVGESSLNGGMGWLHPYYDEDGEFCFKRFEPTEILPFWKDAAHTRLDFGVRLYEVDAYDGRRETVIEKVEIYTIDGIERYVLQEGKLIEDIESPATPYIDNDGTAYNWTKVPLIAFKYNNTETPLITRVKSLQDSINTMLSDFQNNMQEDSRNTILVIKNYDGQDLAEFRHNLAAYGAVKVRSTTDGSGGVDTLQVNVNAENYKAILQLLKKALIESAMGYDAKDDRLMGSPNQMNIMSMFSDIDLDANNMETEYQAAFDDLLWFVNMHLSNTGKGDYKADEVTVVFNRDMLMNEGDIIDNIVKSQAVLSKQTLIAQHPWIDDVDAEMERVETEKENNMENFMSTFTTNNDGSGEDNAER